MQIPSTERYHRARHEFPRLGAFSYWLFLFGGITFVSGFFTPGGAVAAGWFAYSPPLAQHTPGWISGPSGSWSLASALSWARSTS